MVSILTVRCDFVRHYRNVFMVMWFPQQTEVISLHTSNWLVFILDKAFCSVWGKGKGFRYRPGVAQRVGRGIALLFHDHGTRREWVVSSTPWPHFTPGKDPAPILQEAGWAPGPVWTGGKSRLHRDSISDRPARSSVAISTELPGPHVRF